MGIYILQILTCLFLGLLMGSLLLEAMVLVPIWKKMPPHLFLEQHPQMSPYIYSYFKPLTILATMTPILTSILPIVLGVSFHWLEIFPGAVALCLLAIYFFYFKSANAKFYDGSVGIDGLAAELKRWGQWHWFRTILGITGFIASLLVLAK